jgi:hypothetical protein
MNFGSIVLAYQFSQLRAGFERPAGLSGGPAAFEQATHAAQKTVPYEQSVCHKYGCASAEAGAEKKSGGKPPHSKVAAPEKRGAKRIPERNAG